MSNQRSADARSKADALWAKAQRREANTAREKDETASAEKLKTERLRALRLAKEAADKAAAETAAASKAAAKPAGKRPKTP